jgi:hypothetical protein
MSTPSKALLRRTIELGCRAPSVHNTQPWRWRMVGDAVIELYADRGRQLSVSDPSGRNLTLSCGAALHHSIVAARALGLAPDVELVTPGAGEDLLARIHLSRSASTTDAAEGLTSLERRCTDRRRFTSWPIPDARLEHLARAASEWGSFATPITDVTARFHTEELVSRAMTVQASDPRFIAEQDEWVDRSAVDGLRASTTAPRASGRPSTRPNRFATQTRTDETIGSLVESSDGLVAICSALDDQESWLKAGQALSALWLKATHDGFSIVPLSQVVEVEETRHALHHDVFGGMARPQILVRVGWQETSRTKLHRTPRRSVDAVLT